MQHVSPTCPRRGDLIDPKPLNNRPSRAAITIQMTWKPIGFFKTSRRIRAVEITAPIVNGELLVQVDFIHDNGFSSSSSSSSGVSSSEFFCPPPLQYNAKENLQAAAICVEGFVQSSRGRFLRATMHTFNTEDGELSQPWFDWSLDPNDWPEGERDWSLAKKLRHIFKVLFVDAAAA
mmetsp:Transcript_35728/g.75221  ORF Transcript_35728/g.75221 Transcript_35728/m.75221 type:complete len:177 (-) Transcript_35728:466-996(-)